MIPVGGALMTPADIAIATERGRLMALERLLGDPVKRAWMERKYGLPFMKRKWPELYASAPPPVALLWQQFLDRNFGANSGVARA